MGRPKIEIDIPELVRRYEAGEGYDTLCAFFGVSDVTIRGRLREAGVLRETRGPIGFYDAEICKLYDEEMPISDIRKKVGNGKPISVITIYAALRRNGIPLRKNLHPVKCPVLLHRIFRLSKTLTHEKIAKIVGVSVRTLSDIFTSKRKAQCLYYYKRDTSGLVTKIFREYS